VEKVGRKGEKKTRRDAGEMWLSTKRARGSGRARRKGKGKKKKAARKRWKKETREGPGFQRSRSGAP